MKLFGKKEKEFFEPYTCMKAIKEGSGETKLSMLVMGLGNLVHGQAVKGLLFLAAEIAYIVFMITTGFHCLAMLPSLGSVEQEEVWNEELQVYMYTQGDQSILILLYGVATLCLTGIFFLLVWRGALKSRTRRNASQREASTFQHLKKTSRVFCMRICTDF